MQGIKDNRRDPTEPTAHPKAGPCPARCLWPSLCTPASSGRGAPLLVVFCPSFPLVLRCCRSYVALNCALWSRACFEPHAAACALCSLA